MRSIVTTIADVAAAALVIAGVAQMYVPAAYLVAGAAVGAASWRATSGAGAGTEIPEGDR